MFDFFDKILGFIEVIWDYFLNLIESLAMAVYFVGNSVNFTTYLVPFMPAIIGSAIVVFVAIYLIKFLIGR